MRGFSPLTPSCLTLSLPKNVYCKSTFLPGPQDGLRSGEMFVLRTSLQISNGSRLIRIWRYNTVSFASKFKLYKPLVTSILHSPLRLWNMDPACCLWREDPGFRNQVPLETSSLLLLGTQDQRLGAEQDQLPCGSTGTSSGKCQETETCMNQACHTPRQPLLNYPPKGIFKDWRRCGRQRKYWMDNIKEWTSLPMPELLTRAHCGKD